MVAEGRPEDIIANKRSLTGQFLSGARKIRVPSLRRPGSDKFVTIVGASATTFVISTDGIYALSAQLGWEADANGARQIDIVRNAWSSALDPRIPPSEKALGRTSNSKILIDATRPIGWRDDFPTPSALSSAEARAIEDKWLGKLRSN